MRFFSTLLILLSFLSCQSARKDVIPPAQPVFASSDPETTLAIQQMLAQGVQKAIAMTDTVPLTFPPEIMQVEKAVSNMGLKEAVDKFTLSLNEATKKTLAQSRPFFLQVIEDTKFENPETFLDRTQANASAYFKKSQNKVLHELLRPVAEASMKKTEVLANWGQISQAYNSLPIVTKIDVDLAAYITDKTIENVLFKMVEEELIVKRDPLYRTSETMKKVFQK